MGRPARCDAAHGAMQPAALSFNNLIKNNQPADSSSSSSTSTSTSPLVGDRGGEPAAGGLLIFCCTTFLQQRQTDILSAGSKQSIKLRNGAKKNKKRGFVDPPLKVNSGPGPGLVKNIIVGHGQGC